MAQTTRERVLRQLLNYEVAERLWRQVNPERVAYYLAFWRGNNSGISRSACGTHACFGGWLATWPEFMEQGVQKNGTGAPQKWNYEEGYMMDAGDIAQELFDDSVMFEIRREDEGPVSVSDHDIVLQRLEAGRKRLQAVLATLT